MDDDRVKKWSERLDRCNAVLGSPSLHAAITGLALLDAMLAAGL